MQVRDYRRRLELLLAGEVVKEANLADCGPEDGMDAQTGSRFCPFPELRGELKKGLELPQHHSRADPSGAEGVDLAVKPQRAGQALCSSPVKGFRLTQTSVP